MSLLKNKLDDVDAINDIISHLLRAAYRDHAHAVLLEPQSDTLLIFYFIEGEKKLDIKNPVFIYEPLVNRIREMAGLKAPQKDVITNSEVGSIQVEMVDEKYGLHMNYKLRVDISPSPFGSKVLITMECID